MPRVADYLLIKDTTFTIDSDGDVDRQFSFTVASDTHVASHALLSFLYATVDADDLLLKVKATA